MPDAVHRAVEPAVDAPLGALAARGGHLRGAAQHGAELAAPGPVGALALELDALQHPADEPRHAGDRGDVERHQQHREDGRAVRARREVEPGDPLRARQPPGGLGRPDHHPVERLHGPAALDERLHHEEDGGERAPEAHREADHPAVEPARALVDALVDGVGQAGLAAALGAVARQVEGNALVGQHLGVEAPDEPAAGAPVQGRRRHVPQHHATLARDVDGEVGEARRRQDPRGVGDVLVVELRQRREEVGARGGRPDARLAQQRGQPEEERGQRPGLAPPLGDPVGGDQSPEGAEPSHVLGPPSPASDVAPPEHGPPATLHGFRTFSLRDPCSAGGSATVWPEGRPGARPRWQARRDPAGVSGSWPAPRRSSVRTAVEGRRGAGRRCTEPQAEGVGSGGHRPPLGVSPGRRRRARPGVAARPPRGRAHPGAGDAPARPRRAWADPTGVVRRLRRPGRPRRGPPRTDAGRTRGADGGDVPAPRGRRRGASARPGAGDGGRPTLAGRGGSRAAGRSRWRCWGARRAGEALEEMRARGLSARAGPAACSARAPGPWGGRASPETRVRTCGIAAERRRLAHRRIGPMREGVVTNYEKRRRPRRRTAPPARRGGQGADAHPHRLPASGARPEALRPPAPATDSGARPPPASAPPLVADPGPRGRATPRSRSMADRGQPSRTAVAGPRVPTSAGPSFHRVARHHVRRAAGGRRPHRERRQVPKRRVPGRGGPRRPRSRPLSPRASGGRDCDHAAPAPPVVRAPPRPARRRACSPP